MNAKPLRILFDAMHHGKYDFDDFISGEVFAWSEEIRVKGRRAFRPNKKLRAYHSFLRTFLCDHLPVNERVVFSYRKGVGTHHAVSAHAKSRAFFQADLANFFASIDRGLVRELLTARAGDVPIADVNVHVERILDLVTVDDTLPIGFATSPPISNACLTEFDVALEAHCLASGLIYTRYSDDLIVSSQTRESLARVDVTITALLDKYFQGRLRLNAEKTKLTTVGRKIKLLGMVILPTGQVAIDMDLKRRIEVLLYFYVNDRDKFLNVVRFDLDSGIEQLCGYINYVNAVDQIYLDKLRGKFGSTVIDSMLHRSAR